MIAGASGISLIYGIIILKCITKMISIKRSIKYLVRITVSFVTLQWLRIGIVYSYAYTATNPKLQTFNDIWRAAKCDRSQKTRKMKNKREVRH